MLRGLSQPVLGRAIGVTFQQVAKYEKGRDRVSASALYQLAVVLEVPVSAFFTDIPDLPQDRDGAALERSARPGWGGRSTISATMISPGKWLRRSGAQVGR